MNPFRKLAVVLALATLTILAANNAAFTAPGSETPTRLNCSCCPATCGVGTTFVSCYRTDNMPPNAVTCVYRNANGVTWACVSCYNQVIINPV